MANRGGQRAGRRAAAGWLLGVSLAVLAAAGCRRDPPRLEGGDPPRTADTEVREFAISVDGKPAGQYRMTIRRTDRETVVMTGWAEVRVSYLVFSYHYSYQGTETLRAGRLARLESRADDNGQRFQVTAVAEGDRLRVRVNDTARVGPAAAGTTSYWRRPAVPADRPTFHLLDADTGKDVEGRLQFIDRARLTVAGRPCACKHYRVTGPPSPVDLWYDAQDRLVRQDYLDDGHRTVLELKTITPAGHLARKRSS